MGLVYALLMGLVGGLFPAVRAARLPIPSALAGVIGSELALQHGAEAWVLQLSYVMRMRHLGLIVRSGWPLVPCTCPGAERLHQEQT